MTPSIQNTTPAPKTAAPQAANKPQAGRPQEFAQMLSEQQAVATDDSAAPKPAAEAPPAANRAEVCEKPAAKGERAESKKAAKADKAQDTEAEDKTDDTVDTEKTPTDLLQALQLPVQPEALKPADKLTAKPAGEAGELESGVEALSDKPARTSRPGIAAGGAHDKAAKALATRGDDKADVGAARGDAGRADALHAKSETARTDTAWQAVAERVAVVDPAARRELPTVNAAGQLEHMAQPTRTSEAAPVAQASVATSAHSPEFPQALGVQISVLAKDGVQRAELQLNPAEMGPITVRIALDGAQARVEFGVEAATTRQIIENGLPQLASAMRDAGFTLSGGGVHSQSRGRDEGTGQSQGGQGNSHDATLDAADPAARRITTRVSAGGVDLYA